MPIASLSDFKKDEEDNKDTQSYVGGEKSGLAVQNPGDKDADQWKRMQEMAQSQMASGSAAPGGSSVVVTVYRNGFTVGDGPFRPVTDPANKKFMDEMVAGNCPQELQQANGADVSVALNDKHTEEYKTSSASGPVAFAGVGEGQTLSSSSAAAATTTVQAGLGSVQVDDAKPKKPVQIRFHDGQKKAQQFNEDHTVGDLRNFIQECVGGVAMQIMGGFPPKPITDDAQTLKAAGLLGAAVTVRPA